MKGLNLPRASRVPSSLNWRYKIVVEISIETEMARFVHRCCRRITSTFPNPFLVVPGNAPITFISPQKTHPPWIGHRFPEMPIWEMKCSATRLESRGAISPSGMRWHPTLHFFMCAPMFRGKYISSPRHVGRWETAECTMVADKEVCLSQLNLRFPGTFKRHWMIQNATSVFRTL